MGQNKRVRHARKQDGDPADTFDVFLLKSTDTPRAEKILIYSALSYLVLPIDLISAKRLPVIGWIDKLVSLTVAYEKISRYVTPAIEYEVDRILDKWFPMYTEYELIDE